MRLTELYDRTEICREWYWAIPKGVRIDHGLRPDSFEGGYSGAGVISLAEDVLRKGFRGIYPFETDYAWRSCSPGIPAVISSVKELILHLDPMVYELESRLNACRAELQLTKSALAVSN